MLHKQQRQQFEFGLRGGAGGGGHSCDSGPFSFVDTVLMIKPFWNYLQQNRLASRNTDGHVFTIALSFYRKHLLLSLAAL